MVTASVFEVPNLRPMGRFCRSAAHLAGELPLLWGGSGIDGCFSGSELRLLLDVDFDRIEPWISAELNGAPILRMPLNRGLQEVCLFRGMTPGVPKRVRIFKDVQPVSDDPRHRLRVRELRWEDGEFLPLPEPACRLEFVGDSLTSGEGVVGAVSETDWVPALFSASRSWAKFTADRMNAEFRLISQSGWGVRSGWDNHPDHVLPGIYDKVCGPALGQSNEAIGTQNPHDFDSWQPDAVIINLGTNDAGAMGSPPWHGKDGRSFQQTADKAGLALFEDAAVDFLKTLRCHNPAAKLVWVYGMIEGPLSPALGPVLAEAVTRFRREAGDKNAHFLRLPAVREETMGSRQHPGVRCHEDAAQTVAEFLRTIL